MSGYLNNLLTNTTSRYNNLRRQLLSEEADGDTEDDSHLSRVLRAYYTEKGRPFPQWLPPDPRTPQAQPTQFASSGGRQQQGQAPPAGRGGGLSDLWDPPQQQQPPQQQEPLSLRRAAGGRGGPRQLHQGQSRTPEPQSQGRPLPSQRAGSYQSSFSSRQQAEPSPPPSAGSGTTAQDRLKARLWGGRSGQGAGSGERSPGFGGRSSYAEERSESYGSSNSGSSRQQSSFSMASNSPWEGSDDPYAPQGQGGYSGGQQRGGQGGGRVGLPSGPRMR